jgi:DNA-binding MarR family transcriptional regulator
MNDNNKCSIESLSELSNGIQDRIHLKFNELMFKYVAVQKKCVFVIDGIEFRANDIHLIDTIGRHPRANVTELAQYLGVTKGAVSQKLKILEDKGFISRRKDPANAKEVLVELTKFGKEAYLKHEEYHDNNDIEIFNFLRNASPENLRFLLEGLGIINSVMDSYLGEGNSLVQIALTDNQDKSVASIRKASSKKQDDK